MKIFLIRHGQTTGDVEDRYGGDYDDHLSEEGKLQANALKEKLANEKIEIIYCSPKIRAQETGDFLKQKLNCPREIIQGLRERNQNGILTGMIRSEAKEKFPDLVEFVRDYRNTLPKAEPYEDFKTRVLTAWNELLNSNHQVIGILTHGGPIRVIFRELLKKEIKIEDCGYAVFENTKGQLSLIKTDGIVVEN